jgi:hypothetical protein
MNGGGAVSTGVFSMDLDEAMELLAGKRHDRIQMFNQRRGAGDVVPNLSGAVLRGANLSYASLSELDLSRADLCGADLSNAILRETNLSWANLNSADLSGCILNRAILEEASLRGANLCNTYLTGTIFKAVDLSSATLAEAFCRSTVFVDVDLSKVRDLDRVHHDGPSTLGIDTLLRSIGKIPEVFMRGCGLPDAMISYLPSLIGSMSPIQFYSSFISYSAKDTPFAERLYADLQSNGVRCWYAPEDLKIGDKIRVGIDQSIRLHDKLLLILSKNSVESEWVEKEVETAMERERREKRTVLFPIRLDDAVMKIENGWPADIRRSRNIGDFRRWKNHDSYQKSFDRLMRDLQDSKGTI